MPEILAEHPLISVYLPTRNRAALLMRAIDSVLAQDYPHLELIVVDDASTDDTAARIAAHPARARLRYLRQPEPGGACAARNRAIADARGALITGLDDDDAFLPGRLSGLLARFAEGQWSCVSSSVRERTPRGDITRRVDVGRIDLEAMLHYNRLGNQVLTRTAWLREIGGFDPALPALQDYDTWVRLVTARGAAYRLREASYVQFKDHELARISGDRTRVLEGLGRFVAKHRDQLAPRHLDSLEILRRRLAGETLPPGDFLRLVNRGNLKGALPLLINTTPTLAALKRLLALRYRAR
ncbi:MULTISPECIES: glycosyltransferase [Marichromatium]|uniref:Glycosyltransferase involved in cell wall biosynthesis n=1 Tax=Marichromatium gracile TaxID=1048 RepID=A0A4R4ADM7_MARGR|nr:glycosyltransferase [Marichromatium gracile]MBK1709052.1 hypothetical protein [Marichromatium gracile]MBO8086265.1 glycosyltransferase [Marichromatium sp.]TCW36819.1 glycosyltransferase involved in cell wall biosynthesis [Marichromatium gracile]